MSLEGSSISDGDSREYWRGAEDGRLLFQYCHACGSVQFPPRHQCATCWSASLGWIQSSGTGIVESFTVVRRAPVERFRAKVPYVVVAVRVAEGPRMITNLLGDDALEVEIGDKVQVVFSPANGGPPLPQFQRC
jgi:uncharacterized OB-fold protein